MDGWMDGWIIGGVSSSSAVSITLGFSMIGDDDDDDDDVSCMYVSVHMCRSVCDSVSVVGLYTHHHGHHGHHHHHHHHLFSRRLSHSFNVMLVSLTSIHDDP